MYGKAWQETTLSIPKLDRYVYFLYEKVETVSPWHVFYWTLSPGQTNLQVVASVRKLNLRRDLRWVKQTRKFPRKYTQVAKKPFKADFPLFRWLIIG